jgi:restriction endonuclease
MDLKSKNTYNIRTEKKNKIVIEEINPDELNEIWDKLKELNQTLQVFANR